MGFCQRNSQAECNLRDFSRAQNLWPVWPHLGLNLDGSRRLTSSIFRLEMRKSKDVSDTFIFGNRSNNYYIRTTFLSFVLYGPHSTCDAVGRVRTSIYPTQEDTEFEQHRYWVMGLRLAQCPLNLHFSKVFGFPFWNFELRTAYDAAVLSREFSEQKKYYFCISSDFMLIGYHSGGWWSR